MRWTCLVRNILGTALLSWATAAAAAPPPASVQMTLHTDGSGPRIHREIFGQFLEDLGHGIYGGVWVGPKSSIPNTDGYRTDVLDALRALHVPVVRWPGGCFADRYDWRDGVGPRAQRPVTENVAWGGVDDSNAFGTDEFMQLTRLLGARAFIAGNVGSAPPERLAHWVSYITSTSHSKWAQMRRANGHAQPWKLAYVGIGNELWGCGGNMSADYAASVYRRYQTFVHVDGPDQPQRIAPGANGGDPHWIEVMMQRDADFMDGIGLHYYTVPGGFEHKQSATQFNQSDWIHTLSGALHMDALIRRDSAIMDKYDPKRRVALDVDEWGTWYRPEPGSNPAFLRQQNTLRDAMVAALTLNIFVDHAARVRMANIAQMVNVLQAMILTRGRQMVLTPTYYVFRMFEPYQGATRLPLTVQAPRYRDAGVSVPAVQATAARGRDGLVHMVMVNLDPHRAARVRVQVSGPLATAVSGRVLTAAAMNARNRFGKPPAVHPVAFHGASVHGHRLRALLPPKSIVVLSLH